MNDSTGVTYLCTGSYHDMLKNSLRSLQKTNPETNFHILSDRPLSVPFTWIPSWTGKASRKAKTRLSEYTPFDLNLFVDTDTVFAEALDISALLGDADIAMGLDADPKLGRGAEVFLKYPGFTSEEEVEETLSLCGRDFPFYNSGVIIWRQTDKVKSFFARWHQEWSKYQGADQLALARTIQHTGIRVNTLKQRYNHPVLNPNLKPDQAIYHLIFKEKIAKQVGLWDPGTDQLDHAGLAGTLKKGARAENQYLHIGQQIYNDPDSSVLVVCPNGDEAFWRYCSRGKCGFVEEANGSANHGPNDTYFHHFDSRVGKWCDEIQLPGQIDKPYDYIVINGPRGYDESCPGREIPIAWASQLARKAVFVFDHDRTWEREASRHYLGEADRIIAPAGKKGAELAAFAMA